MKTIELNGRDYVIMERTEYEHLATKAKAADLPALPEPDLEGNYPAVEYARASIARSIIRERAEAGLNQRGLAKLAGIPVETLCRIETGKTTPSVPTIQKIDRALRKALAQKRKGR